MKLFFALIQSVILALTAWYLFDFAVQDYQGLASLDTNTVAAERYAGSADAATKAITTGKNLINAGAVKVSAIRLAFTAGSAVIGFFAWFIAAFIVSITTRPFTTISDSTWGNFSRNFVAPLFTVTFIGVGVLFSAVVIIIQSLF